MDKSKNYILFGFLALLVSLIAASLAYISYQQSLDVESNALNDVEWNVHLINLAISHKSDGVIVNIAPTITGGTVINDYSITFTKIDDYIEYTFDVVNTGTFNAKLVDIKIDNPSCSSLGDCNVLYELYDDYTKLERADDSILDARTGKKTYKIRLTEASSIKRKMKNKDLIFWLAQLSTYIKAGIPLADAVKVLARQDKRTKYRSVYDAIIYELTMGESFSEALKKQGNVFPALLSPIILYSPTIKKC